LNILKENMKKREYSVGEYSAVQCVTVKNVTEEKS
jgi:hypothetical protein